MSDLEVSISDQKTHISGHMYEFAKRWYRNSVEISGIPIKGFLGVHQFWWRAIPEVVEALARIGESTRIPAPVIFSDFFKI